MHIEENIINNIETYQPRNKGFLPNILITGVPGSGKTSFAKILVDTLNNKLNEAMNINDINAFKVINLGEEIANNKLWKEWDSEFNCSVFDPDMVVDHLEAILSPNGGYVIDFHSTADFPLRWMDLVVQLRCDNTVLYDRLSQRGYR